MTVILDVIAKGNVHYYVHCVYCCALNDPAKELTNLPVISTFLAVQNSSN